LVLLAENPAGQSEQTEDKVSLWSPITLARYLSSPARDHQTETEAILQHRPTIALNKATDLKKTLAKLGSDISNTSVNASNEAIRSYFLDLTLEFLAPIEAYLKTLFPGTSQLSVLKGLPKLGAFKEADFLRHYSINGGKDIDTYRKFLRTPNFVNWFRERKVLLQDEVLESYLVLFELKRMHTFIADKSRSKSSISSFVSLNKSSYWRNAAI
jgi:hypothetical protein